MSSTSLVSFLQASLHIWPAQCTHQKNQATTDLFQYGGERRYAQLAGMQGGGGGVEIEKLPRSMSESFNFFR
jgi:hypothetical protein